MESLKNWCQIWTYSAPPPTNRWIVYIQVSSIISVTIVLSRKKRSLKVCREQSNLIEKQSTKCPPSMVNLPVIQLVSKWNLYKLNVIQSKEISISKTWLLVVQMKWQSQPSLLQRQKRNQQTNNVHHLAGKKIRHSLHFSFKLNIFML